VRRGVGGLVVGGPVTMTVDPAVVGIVGVGETGVCRGVFVGFVVRPGVPLLCIRWRMNL
jgi:hypothetical protein